MYVFVTPITIKVGMPILPIAKITGYGLSQSQTYTGGTSGRNEGYMRLTLAFPTHSRVRSQYLLIRCDLPISDIQSALHFGLTS